MDTATRGRAIDHGLHLSTERYAPGQRHEWLRNVIGKEYAHVTISVPKTTPLFNEMNIYPWQDMRLSSIKSNSITIHRKPGECHSVSQDAYFAVILLSGKYLLEQNGREVFLKPGEMTLYDATRPHRIYCPEPFSKLIVSIPRAQLRHRLAGVEHCTARQISNQHGACAITSDFIQSAARHVNELSMEAFAGMASQALDLLALSIAEVRPGNYSLSRSRSLSLYRVKELINGLLADATLDTSAIANASGLSPRYINSLFEDENTSLMRHVWQRRLEKCKQDMLNPAQRGHSISEIALRWGFNDLAHFSRAFKKQFGLAPREYRQSGN
ncbi:helix-turn-helix domain-containing protein [Methylobacillus caricis]|uniref:AraC-like ligand-binding domain-containing protein n=1 Tax=Methylobacillus caricis TaxID=1971611 RepID=UPI001D000614|nr:helix-turn-helix domain-containing protein [Methylobacillus caricis]MCB5186505.1 helix-turn-helix domain-containing protein [Methylobacillus caricis]